LSDLKKKSNKFNLAVKWSDKFAERVLKKSQTVVQPISQNLNPDFNFSVVMMKEKTLSQTLLINSGILNVIIL
jgi:hypothetical protein